MAFIQKLGQLRTAVAAYANLPIIDNVLGDVRLTTNTGDAYVWLLVSSSGSLTDWKKVTDSSYNDLLGSPTSSGLAIDNAIKIIKNLAINITLLAFQTLTDWQSSVAKMVDGMANQFVDESGMETELCSNQVFFSDQGKGTNGYYMPNKGDLDINTKMLIHGDGIQGNTSFIDLFKQPLVNHGVTVDTTTKKFGTGSLKFNGSSYFDLGQLVMIGGKDIYSETMTLDFWLNANTGAQPILVNQAYSDEYDTWTAGQVLSITKGSDNKITASILVGTSNMGEMTYSTVTVTSASAVTSNVWSHIAIQKVNGYLQIWINGVLDATSSTSGISNTQPVFVIRVLLSFGKLSSTYLNGYIDEIRLSNATRYTSTFTPPTKAYNTSTVPPVDETVIVDAETTPKTVTSYGNARMSGSNPLMGNASLYLDGINSYLSVADSDDWQICTSSGGIDSNTKLLLHLDNNVTDSESTPKTVTNNNVTFSNSVYKFGYSGYFNGTSSYLSIPDSGDWQFGGGTGAFTIDCWINYSSISITPMILSQNTGVNPTFNFYFTGNNLYVMSYNGGYVILFSAPFTPTLNTWYHIALVRIDNGNSSASWRIFVNGVSQTLTLSQGNWNCTIPNLAAPLNIGTDLRAQSSYSLNGYLDELRISNVARWTSNFTPSTLAYGTLTLEDYTIDLWIDPISLTDLNTYIIGQDDSWKLTLDGSSNKYLKYTVIGGTSIVAPVTLSLNSWTHVAIVQSSGMIKLYVNGILGASIAGTAVVNGTQPLTIGATHAGANMFNGFIEEVRVSKGIARWTAAFTPPSVEYTSDSSTKLLLPLNVITVPNMTLESVGYVANYVPTSARVVIFEEDIDVMEANVDLVMSVSRDGGTTFSNVILAKDMEFGDDTLNIFTGSVDLTSQPSGSLMVWKVLTQNNKDCRIRGVSLTWR